MSFNIVGGTLLGRQPVPEKSASRNMAVFYQLAGFQLPLILVLRKCAETTSAAKGIAVRRRSTGGGLLHGSRERGATLQRVEV
jgi:hypothetical protein